MLLAIACASTFVIDLATKSVVRHNCSEGRVYPVGRLFTIRLAMGRRRVASASGRAGIIALWVAAAAAVIAARVFAGLFQTPLAEIGVGCALGGAAGNASDLVHRGSIIDFFDLGWWPVFNFADVAIVGGLAAALLSLR